MNLEVKTIEPKPGFLELSRHQLGSYNTQDIKSLSFQRRPGPFQKAL